ncbi:hypothetical protein JL193_04640 [Polaribacter batillariae]|uniref:Holin-X, holin superfamily III n=1 Tax=Polaribacter batillariae TaxID=2808900 RepID=A0ABX7SWE2_9FLAO|nr:hypothetical protein [Polaribacter batillariae]QTD38572.1 hypothetical protein JL193_04640 [Polaribacter batillariae]
MKKKEILIQQKKQDQLKKEIEYIKKTIPICLAGFSFVMLLIIFFLEDKLYIYFKGAINFIIVGIAFTIIIGILFYSYCLRKIKAKEKQSKAISIKLYSLMKLEK